MACGGLGAVAPRERGLGRSPSRGPGDRVPGQGVWGRSPPEAKTFFKFYKLILAYKYAKLCIYFKFRNIKILLRTQNFSVIHMTCAYKTSRLLVQERVIENN